VTSLNGKEPELVEEIMRYRLDIVGVSSTLKRGSGSEVLDKGWKLFYSGTDDPQRRVRAGVGILTSPRMSAGVLEFYPHGERVASLRLRVSDRKTLTFIVVYAPNVVSEYSAFLEDLLEVLERVPPTDSLILVGDFNAHVGVDSEKWKGVIGRNGDPDLNPSGELVLDFCAGNGLSITNTFFPHRDGHKYTWRQDTLGRRSVIDFVVVSTDLKSLVLDTRVKRGAELSTDHHLVVSQLRCTGKRPDRPRKPRCTTRVKWECLADDGVREDFQARIRERQSCVPPVCDDIEIEWSLFRAAVVEAAISSCGLKRVGVAHGGGVRTPWWTPEVRASVAAKKVAFLAWLGSGSPDLRERYRTLRKEAAKAVAEAKVRAWESFGEEMEADYRTANKVFWQTIRRIRRGKRDSLQVLKDRQGGLLTSEEDILQRWREHFDELLNPVEASSSEPVLEAVGEIPLIPLADVAWAVKALKSGKAAGVDEIRPEMLKALGIVGLEWLTRVFNVAWTTGRAPEDWQIGVVIPLFKKGDQRECSNYRGITLLSLPGKSYAKVLEKRCREIVEPKI